MIGRPYRAMEKAGRGVAHLVLAVATAVVCMAIPKRRHDLIWGPVPILNYRYWSAGLRRKGWASRTFMYVIPIPVGNHVTRNSWNKHRPKAGVHTGEIDRPVVD